MSNEETKKLEDFLKGAIRPLKKLVEALKSKVDHQELYLVATSSNVKSIKEQQSVINEKLDTQGKKLDILWDQVERVTMNLEEVSEAQALHTSSLKRIEVKMEGNDDDVRKVNKRLITTENRLGIVPPPELTIN